MRTRLFDWLADGKSMRSFCRLEDTPHVSTITKLLVRDDDFFAHYVKARESAGHAHGDKIIEVVEMLEESPDMDAAKARVMIDALKWVSERMAPKSFQLTTKLDHTTKGDKITPPVTWATPPKDDGASS